MAIEQSVKRTIRVFQNLKRRMGTFTAMAVKVFFPRYIFAPTFRKVECGSDTFFGKTVSQECAHGGCFPQKRNRGERMRSESLFIKCKACGNDISKTAKSCPKCGHKIKKYRVGYAVAGAALMLVLAAGMSGTDKSQGDSGAPADAARTSGQQEKSAVAGISMPADEALFIDIVSRHAGKFTSAGNELQESMIRDERKKELARSGIANSISGWKGTIKSLQTNTDGDAILSVRIAPGIEVTTWNNALSDITAGTLIKKGSPLYARLAGLSKGQMVVFSGRFLPSGQDYFEETSVTINGSMKNPEFLFIFENIEAN